MELTAKLIASLSENKEVYDKTAFILTYDEGGQFFDHHWTPTPPRNTKLYNDGKSTVSTEGELTKDMIDLIEKDHPIGLGFRVPMIIVSPWTRGGYIYSGVADHTSSIKFLEKRFNFTCENISPWRRAIASDLLDAFDFKNPDYSWPDHLPDTSDNYNKTGK